MNTLNEIHKQNLESLKSLAIERLDEAIEGIKKWTERVRPENGIPGRFRWAIQSTREANVASTKYMLDGLRGIDIYDEVITEKDKKAGMEWVQSMHLGNGQYRDPAICDRKPPSWPENEMWPSPSMQVIINQYAQGVLRSYSGAEFPSSPPPAGWPQPNDPPERMVEWIKSRNLDEDPWGAGSHAARLAIWMLQWYSEGYISVEPLLEIIEYFYEKQDPETGLWGSKKRPLFERINGTFKLFIFLQYALDLPLPHAEKIVDNTIGEFYRSNYDKTAGGCDEYDNWYVIALASRKTAGYREEEIEKLAAYRIKRVLDLHQKPDGGLSYYANGCATRWSDCDMAPSLSQGDAVGLAMWVGGINICVDMLGLKGRVSWSGEWGHTKARPPEVVKRKIRDLVLGSEYASGSLSSRSKNKRMERKIKRRYPSS